MSKKHSVERARAYRQMAKNEYASATVNTIHWAGLIISITVLLGVIGLLYGFSLAGFAFVGSGGVVAFFIGYAVGVYGFSVRAVKVRYDYASVAGILVGLLFVLLNLITYTAFGSIYESLATAGYVESSIIGFGVFGVLALYIVFGFVSARETKV